MTDKDLLKQWKKEERAKFKGWDFSYLKRRMIEEQPPWNYISAAKKLVRKSNSVLDMGTGGGEIFSLLAPFPKHTFATEGWTPNVAVAKKQLEPLGVKVIEVDESGILPFRDAEFDVVLNRHELFVPTEVFRVLCSGGTFLTQQAGGGNLKELVREFFRVSHRTWTMKLAKKYLQNAGFIIQEAREWRGKVEFKDVDSIVYFLKAVPWVVGMFSVDGDLRSLENLQEKLDKGKRLVFNQERFLIRARKP